MNGGIGVFAFPRALLGFLTWFAGRLLSEGGLLRGDDVEGTEGDWESGRVEGRIRDGVEG